VVTNWERIKREEKGRKRLLGGIPAAMPALARAATIERKLASAGLGWHIADPAPGPAPPAPAAPGPADPAPAATPGERILAIARAAAAAGEDPEAALRRALDRLVEKVGELEAAAAERGVDVSELPAADRAALEIGSPPPPGTSGAGFAPG
jgi:XTP/dITP diphosphohydrolase